jgi:hypothetical protein
MLVEMLVGIQTDGRRDDFNRRSGIMRTLLVKKSVGISCMYHGGCQAVMAQLLLHSGRSCFPLLSLPCVCLVSRRSV